MLSIPTALYDSARIDGASWFQIKIWIILPIVTPTIFVLSLLYMIGTFQVWETIYLLRPIQAANNLMMDVYLTGFTFSRYGMAAAKSIVLMILILSLSLIKRRIEK
jgi:multiple sugar transport system permease protein